MRHFLRGLWILTTAFAISSCEVPPEADLSATGGAVALPATDAEIAARLYAGTPRTPLGFVSDPAPAPFSQVTTYHIKSREIDAAAATSYELCSDDWTEALGWSETVAAQAPVYLDLVANNETAGYYEFDRVPRGEPERYVRLRVYRCGYLNRVGVDLPSGAEFAGSFNHQPLDATALRELSEYLWLFTAYNNADHVVVASTAQPQTAGLAHAITIASLERAAVSPSCDRVALREWTHTADVATGELRLTTRDLRTFAVHREGGAILGC